MTGSIHPRQRVQTKLECRSMGALGLDASLHYSTTPVLLAPLQSLLVGPLALAWQNFTAPNRPARRDALLNGHFAAHAVAQFHRFVDQF